ncbi:MULTISPECIES: DUF4060 family protein [Kosakonia]|uniref:DUF4060 family protein n=1 Tax=Kosakonia TaxID=1330547 RepID=UPI001658DB4F|nr:MULTISPECIES: DUF4060 family protein [Kosakonia]MDF2624690.1 hypothetical protein [Kosakonia cowanii]MDY0889627.1 DUF4060 family protein [Kosakonia sp. CFBP8986]QNQ20754.1 DUF4060 family protein [Kosakonia sp. SMBL-WEM22]UGS47883.1 DUF4060 family protein [Kosakonia cowanii]
MRLINRSRKDSPMARRACDAALARHVERFGDYASRAMTSVYTVLVDGMKVTVEVENRSTSYVATAIMGARRLRALAGRMS